MKTFFRLIFELEDENVQPSLTIEKALYFKTEIEDDVIITFISHPFYVPQYVYQLIETTVNDDVLEISKPNLEEEEEGIPTTIIHYNTSVEIELGKTLNINPNLTPV